MLVLFDKTYFLFNNKAGIVISKGISMNEAKKPFAIPENLKPADMAKLGIKKIRRKLNITDKILYVFYTGAKHNKHQLTLDEITIAYYNLFHKSEGKTRSKKEIALKLYNMRGAPDRHGNPSNGTEWIELVPGKRGAYRLKKTVGNLANRRIDDGELLFSDLNLDL